MEVSKQEARDAIDQVEDAMGLTRRAIADGGASPVLIAWGAIWVVGFMASHIWGDGAARLWPVLNLIGIASTFLVLRRAPFRSAHGRGLGLFWWLLFVYGFLWLMVIAAASPRPVTVTGRQIGAYIVTLVMFAYVVMGLWLRSALLFWLGLAVTGVTAAALFLFAPYFCLIMAFAGGGALAGAGIGIHRAWR